MATDNRRHDEVLPNPDPSFITTQQIDKAIQNLEEKISARLEGIEKANAAFHGDLTRVPTLLDRSITSLRELIETRMKCVEEDVDGVHAALGKQDAEIAGQITHLRELINAKIALANEKTENLFKVSTEKFNGIEKQFSERDKRTEQLFLSDKTAIIAALQAQKEASVAQNESNVTANAKTETNLAKLIEQNNSLVMEIRRNTDIQLNDLKSRLDKGEGKISVSDPAISDALRTLNGSVNRLNMSEGHATGKTEGIGMIGSIVLGAIAGLSFLTAVGSLIFAIVRRA